MAGEGKRRKLSNGDYKPVEPPYNTTAEVEADTTKLKKDQRSSLFVRSLPASITTERLTEFFSESYPLKHATVVLDPQTKISRGFGFVTFADAEDAQAAAAEFNNAVLDGRKIKVEVAESRNREIVQDGGRSSTNTKAVELRAQREKQKEEAQPPRLIVRNLPWSIKEPEDLALLFRSYGKVKHVVLPKKGPRAQSGFGFVVLRGIKNAEKALKGVNGKEIDGRTLAVDWAVDKKTWNELQDGEREGDEATDKSANGINGKDDQASSQVSSEGELADASEVLDADDSMADADVGVDLDDEIDADEDLDEESEEEEDEAEPDNTTVFIRNVPFTSTDESLHAHFLPFGAVRYARVVFDPETERPKGTAFVCFFNADDAKACVKDAPKHEAPTPFTSETGADKKRRGETLTHSILQNESTDPSGKYTMDGRILQVNRALSKTDANRRAEIASDSRDKRDHDKRRLFLLGEGTVARGTKLYEDLGKAELDIREASAKQRQKLIKTNPNLCLSLTRLSVRNIPRSVGSKELKALAREAVVGFAVDVKGGKRQPLSKEESTRGGEAMKLAERQRKEKGVGIVRQAKIVFEGREGGKVKEGKDGEAGEGGGAGRSRGYGFIEYVGHRNALMGLRWLNGRSVKGVGGERNKRLIVEFAIENAQVVQRRGERESRAREGREEGRGDPNRVAVKSGRFGKVSERRSWGGKDQNGSGARDRLARKDLKRKRDDKSDTGERSSGKGKASRKEQQPKAKAELVTGEEKNKLAKRNRIIAKKRHARSARKGK